MDRTRVRWLKLESFVAFQSLSLMPTTSERVFGRHCNGLLRDGEVLARFDCSWPGTAQDSHDLSQV